MNVNQPRARARTNRISAPRATERLRELRDRLGPGREHSFRLLQVFCFGNRTPSPRVFKHGRTARLCEGIPKKESSPLAPKRNKTRPHQSRTLRTSTTTTSQDPPGNSEKETARVSPPVVPPGRRQRRLYAVARRDAVLVPPLGAAAETEPGQQNPTLTELGRAGCPAKASRMKDQRAGPPGLPALNAGPGWLWPRPGHQPNPGTPVKNRPKSRSPKPGNEGEDTGPERSRTVGYETSLFAGPISAPPPAPKFPQVGPRKPPVRSEHRPGQHSQ